MDIRQTLNAIGDNWDGIVQLGQELREQSDKEQFLWGDLAIFVTQNFGPENLRDYALSIKKDYKTLCRYRDVAKAYTPEERERFSYLSWTHFRAAAAKPNRIELLENAADKDYSVEKMEVMASDDDGVIRDVDDVPPKPKLQFCRISKKWYIPSEKTCPANCTHSEKEV